MSYINDTNTASQLPASQGSLTWTGAQKAGWFFVGMIGGILGILMASLTNVGHPDRSTATKMAAFGVAAWFVLWILLFCIASCSTAMLAASLSTY